MSKIKMKKTTKGSLNGINVVVFEVGKEYTIGNDITKRLADVFIGMRVAEKVDIVKHVEEIKTKAIEEAPINKAIESSPSNKTVDEFSIKKVDKTDDKPKNRWSKRKK